MFQFLASKIDCPPPRFPVIERWLRRLGEAAKARHRERQRQKVLATLNAQALYDIGASDLFAAHQANPLTTQNPYVLAVEIVTRREV